jgi:hypothetical protein
LSDQVHNNGRKNEGKFRRETEKRLQGSFSFLIIKNKLNHFIPFPLKYSFRKRIQSLSFCGCFLFVTDKTETEKKALKGPRLKIIGKYNGRTKGIFKFGLLFQTQLKGQNTRSSPRHPITNIIN